MKTYKNTEAAIRMYEAYEFTPKQGIASFELQETEAVFSYYQKPKQSYKQVYETEFETIVTADLFTKCIVRMIQGKNLDPALVHAAA